MRQRLLVVDDEEWTRLLLARMLSQDLGAEVQLAGTCEQALRFASGAVYHAILLDLRMPGVGGFGVLRLAAGANAVHLKPVDRNKLLAIVREQLAARANAKPTSR